MRAVVTGGEGFIGSHLVDALIRDGWSVTIVDDVSTFSTTPPAPQGVGYVRANAAEVILPTGVDAIFHLAGKVGPTGVLKFAGRIAPDTIESAHNMGLQAKRLGIPLIDISTSEVYGSPDRLNAEDDPKIFGKASARQEYAISKLAAEVMLLNTKGLDVRIIRPFNVAGPRQRADGGFVLPRFVQQALRNEPLTVYYPGTQQRSFTHVSDIVDGILKAYDKGDSGEVYNLGNPDNACSITQLAEEVLSAVDPQGKIEIVDPTTIHGPSFREAPDKVPNADKARERLGWVPVWSRDEIIEDVVNYERTRWRSTLS